MINHHVDVPCQGRECRDVILLLKKKMMKNRKNLYNKN